MDAWERSDCKKRFLFPIRPCVCSCWRRWELLPAQLAPCLPKAWAPQRPPGSCRSQLAGLFTSPRWPCCRNCWRAAPVLDSPWWRFWPCCLESAWWCWSLNTSEKWRSWQELFTVTQERLSEEVTIFLYKCFFSVRGVNVLRFGTLGGVYLVFAVHVCYAETESWKEATWWKYLVRPSVIVTEGLNSLLSSPEINSPLSLHETSGCILVFDHSLNRRRVCTRRHVFSCETKSANIVW